MRGRRWEKKSRGNVERCTDLWARSIRTGCTPKRKFLHPHSLSPSGWLMNSPLTRPSAFALLPGHRFCSVSTGPARRAHSQQPNRNTRAAVIVCEISLKGKCFFIQGCVKWHTKEVNHRGCSHCALRHIKTTYRRISFLKNSLLLCHSQH